MTMTRNQALTAITAFVLVAGLSHNISEIFHGGHTMTLCLR